MQFPRRIGIFGSTGSIGTQALEVIVAHPDLFKVTVLTAWKNADLLIQQAIRFHPQLVVIGDEQCYATVKNALQQRGIRVLAGVKGLEEAAAEDIYDIHIAAIVGFAGLKPTLSAIQNGKTIALANKETLVVAGEWVMEAVKHHQARIIPVDSEHSAIFQCLEGEQHNRIEKIILTASGGPFLGKKPNFLVNVKKDHALQHPNWRMGEKITIDSSSLMNKGLEMIEARWLFNLQPDQIEVVIHPQSVIHSLIQFEDGSLKAQLGLPDMKLPIQYALSYPHRIANNFPRFSFKQYPSLSFEAPDTKTFRNLAIAMEVLRKGGNAACVMNAANEEAVWAFLKNKIGFLDMSDVIEQTLEKVSFIPHPNLAEYEESDRLARRYAQLLIDKIQSRS
ncbi:MAG: 1-deoxy-D-xylulose-5-phosphate reductoisomerase [Thermoflavifilum sp.]|nr:1-deoxy-D-xylulose-5-phosphate reductoisomerase [Thermoflavifilum sp.]